MWKKYKNSELNMSHLTKNGLNSDEDTVSIKQLRNGKNTLVIICNALYLQARQLIYEQHGKAGFNAISGVNGIVLQHFKCSRGLFWRNVWAGRGSKSWTILHRSPGLYQ